MTRTIFSIAAMILFAVPLQGAEIRWGRGTAAGMFIGNYTDTQNWDGGVVPGSADRARVDRGGTEMILDSTILANEFLFGVDEKPQTFTFLPTADVSINTNFFVSLNRGGVTVDIQEGATISAGGNFLLGQHDNCCGGVAVADSDITVTIAGEVTVNKTLIAEQYGSNPLNPPFFNDFLLDVTSGTLTTQAIEFASNGDLDVFFDPINENTITVRVGDGGLISLEGDKVALIEDQIAEGFYVTDSTEGPLGARYDAGADRTLVQVQTSPTCDLDGDGDCDSADMRVLYDEIAAGTKNNDDIETWLTDAGAENGKTYKAGDTDLDGAVGGPDFTELAFNFGNTGIDNGNDMDNAYWDQGNFDGNLGGQFAVGGPDFTGLAFNFGHESVSAVPEPVSMALLLMAVTGMLGLARKR